MRPSIEDLEAELLWTKTTVDADPRVGNLGDVEKNPDYKSSKTALEYWYYIMWADEHYFAGRTLFMQHIIMYSYFCFQQCVELYLKAYLKCHGVVPPDTHSLSELLQACRALSAAHDFIKSDYLEVITRKFGGFNEYPRYPIQKNRPKDGKYVFMWPRDVYYVDYFVFKMRQLVSIPDRTRDLLRGDESYDLEQCKTINPAFYASFRQDNYNFPNG